MVTRRQLMVEAPHHDSTHWSVIAKLHDGRPDDSWDVFIRRYRGYVAAVLRHHDLRPNEVEAATEEFWSYLFLSRAVERADRNGRFRSFLAGVVRNYAKSWRREQARGQASTATDDTLAALPDPRPDVEVDLWGIQVLHLGLTRLGREKPDSERALRWFYGVPDEVGGDEPGRLTASRIADRLGSNANAVHQLMLRARNDLRHEITKEVARTVGNSPELREELLLLLAAIERFRPGIVESVDPAA